MPPGEASSGSAIGGGRLPARARAWTEGKEKPPSKAARKDKGKGKEKDEQPSEKGGRRKTRKAEQERDEGEGADDDMLQVVLKAELNLIQVTRALQGSVWTTAMCPTEFGFVQEALAAGKHYHDTVKEQGSAELGPPHSHIALSFLQELAKDEGEAGGDLVDIVAELNKQHTKEIALLIPYFRVKEGHPELKDEKGRHLSIVTWSFDTAFPFACKSTEDGGLLLHRSLVKALRKKKVELKPGSPPKGKLERVLEKKLKKLQVADA